MTELQTGLMRLDEALGGGLRAGELLVICGEARVGKTALSLTILAHLAAARTRILYESLGGDEVGVRRAVGAFNASNGGGRDGRDTAGVEMRRGALSAAELRGWIVQAGEQTPVVCVDPLGLYGAQGPTEGRPQYIHRVTAELAQLATATRSALLVTLPLRYVDVSTHGLDGAIRRAAIAESAAAILALERSDERAVSMITATGRWESRRLRIIRANGRAPAVVRVWLDVAGERFVDDPALTSLE